MSRLATSFVLGYHGCDYDVAISAVNGDIGILQSEKDYDWLGPGAYFWESDPKRAKEWAEWKVSTKAYKKAAVVGAVIDLGNCLDLMNRDDIELVKIAHRRLLADQKTLKLPPLKNKSVPNDPNKDRILRFLDCAVIRYLHKALADDGRPPIDTVRGMFTEGKKLYRHGGFRERTHVQIAVCNDAMIKGIFHPRDFQ